MSEPKENKTKAELLVEINNLKKQIADNEEFLTEIGIIQKETFMSRIEAMEENTVKKIDDLIAECVNETGRDFPWILIDQKILKKDKNYDLTMGTFLHKEMEKALQGSRFKF